MHLGNPRSFTLRGGVFVNSAADNLFLMNNRLGLVDTHVILGISLGISLSSPTGSFIVILNFV